MIHIFDDKQEAAKFARENAAFLVPYGNRLWEVQVGNSPGVIRHKKGEAVSEWEGKEA